MIEPKATTPDGLMARASFYSGAMDRQSERELQLLLIPTTAPRGAAVFPGPQPPPASPSEHPQVDLSLSIRTGPPSPPPPQQQQPSTDRKEPVPAAAASEAVDVQALKQQTEEQSRLASAERAYAERVMELARREVELAEREFARARAIWERARVEVEKVERMKEMAAARRLIGLGSAAALAEITCHACMQRFHP